MGSGSDYFRPHGFAKSGFHQGSQAAKLRRAAFTNGFGAGTQWIYAAVKGSRRAAFPHQVQADTLRRGARFALTVAPEVARTAFTRALLPAALQWPIDSNSCLRLEPQPVPRHEPPVECAAGLFPKRIFQALRRALRSRAEIRRWRF